MAEFQFERGSRERPRGHALFYVRSAAGPDAVLATYLVVLPVEVDIAKYIPPMLAGSMPDLAGAAGTVSAMPWPPIPEAVASQAYLERLADARDDDLIYGGTADPGRLDALMQLTGEAAREYAQLYAERAEAPAAEREDAPAPELDVDEVLYGLMGERDRLTELVKLTGALRDAVEAGDQRRRDEALASLRKLTRHFPEKYRIADFLAVAPVPGEKARRLVELYVDRCYRVCNEDYAGLQEIDEKIKDLSGRHG